MVANTYAPVTVDITVSSGARSSITPPSPDPDPSPDYSAVMSSGQEVVSNGATVIITKGS